MTEPNEELDTQDPVEPVTLEPDKDIQAIKSWIGRVEKSNQETAATQKEILEALNSQQQRPDPESSDINTKLHEMMLNGQVMEAYGIMNDIHSDAAKQQSTVKERRFDDALNQLKDQPLFKDIGDKVEETARKLMNKGNSPEVSVKMAQLTVERGYQDNLLAALKKRNPGAFEMLEGGNPEIRKGDEGKLTESEKIAYERGLKDNLWKNEEEFLPYARR